MIKQVLQLLLLLPCPIGQLLRRAAQLIQVPRRFIALQPAQRGHGVTQSFCRAARTGRITLVHGTTHRLLRLAQPIQGLAYGGLRLGTGRAGRAALTGVAGLAGLARLA